MKNVKWVTISLLIIAVLLPGLAMSDWTFKKRGFTILPVTPESWSSVEFFETVRNMQSIGVNIISLRIAWQQPTMEATEMSPYRRTPTDAALLDAINYIKSRGLKFALHVVVNTPEWRANINPSDREAWFRSMGDFAEKYAEEFAGPYGADHFSVGTEMYGVVSNLHNPENAAAPGRYRWPEVIAAVRQHYNGPVTYSAQHSGDRSAVLEDNDLMPHLDFLGFSAYWAIFANNAEQLSREWQRIEDETIIPAITLYDKSIALHEVGYRPCGFTLARPYDSQSECTYDGEAQAFAWEGLLNFFADKEYLIGLVGGWAFNDDPAVGGPGHTDYTPWNKPAATTFRAFWPLVSAEPEDQDPPTTDTPPALLESQYAGAPF